VLKGKKKCREDEHSAQLYAKIITVTIELHLLVRN
jgi:hypothetical protein